MRGFLTFLGLFVAAVAAVHVTFLSPTETSLTKAASIAKEIRALPNSKSQSVAVSPTAKPADPALDLSTDPIVRPDPELRRAFGIPPDSENSERAKRKARNRRRLARSRATARPRWMREVFQQD